MGFTHIDLIGLNKHIMRDAPIVRDNTELLDLAKESVAENKSLSIAGMRHSQGGHTALKEESMVFTEAMEQSIVVSADRKTVKVNAGATWSDLHFHLGPMGLAPLVHQSSPHFSIGGSLSVDCHGREVHEGALSNTVESITVLTNKNGKLDETNASRDENPELFWATLGGYGACGVILNATLKITKNIYMYKFGNQVSNLAELKSYLIAASKKIRYVKHPPPYTSAVPISMFYAWMNVSTDSNKYLTDAMVYEYVEDPAAENRMRVKDFKNEGWATTELMRAAWVAGRRSANLRGQLFDEVVKITTGELPKDSLINFLREEISFTSSKGDASDVDLLQEFFIPLLNIEAFLTKLKDTLLPLGNTDIQVLSCTLRVIQAPPKPAGQAENHNNKPFLSYANRDDSSGSMVSVALEIKVKKTKTDEDSIHTGFEVESNALKTIRDIINEAQNRGGSYYLPYYQAAELTQFKHAYPRHTKWKAQADIWNPVNTNGKRVFDNEFLQKYLK